MKLTKFDLKSKFALITGSGGLLGQEHALALLEVNANIILTDINTKKINLIRKKLIKLYPSKKILSYRMDVTKPDSIKYALNNLKKEKIYVSILINNAAIDSKINNKGKFENKNRIENLSLFDWNKQLEVGLTGAMLCSKYFGSEMAKRSKGGIILNIASDLSVISPYQKLYKKNKSSKNKQPVKPVMYSVVKHGLIGLTKYLSTYWPEKNIRCNAISPGAVYTNQPQKFVKRIKNLIPLNRLAEKSEYRSIIQFLCSDASSYMTGQNIIIDGGRSVW